MERISTKTTQECNAKSRQISLHDFGEFRCFVLSPYVFIPKKGSAYRILLNTSSYYLPACLGK